MEAILVGGFIEIIELCELCNINIIGIIDHTKPENERYPYLGSDADAVTLYEKYSSTPLIVTPDMPHIRKKLVNYYESIGYSFLTLISPKAEISKSCFIEKGTVIQSCVNVSSNARIGPYVKLNTNATIMHDCKINAFTTVAPGAVLLGRVIIHKQCYIGANSTILPNITIAHGSIVGAGSVVTKDVKAHTTVKGTAAK